MATQFVWSKFVEGIREETGCVRKGYFLLRVISHPSLSSVNG